MDALKGLTGVSTGWMAAFAVLLVAASRGFLPRLNNDRGSSAPILILAGFLAILGLSGYLTLNKHKEAHYELNNIPSPRANETAIKALRASAVPADQGNPVEGWVYCGDYDSSNQRWIYKYVDVDAKPGELKDKKSNIRFTIDVFQEPPTFSYFGLQWKFGKVITSIPLGGKVAIMEMESLGKDRIWCKIQTI